MVTFPASISSTNRRYEPTRTSQDQRNIWVKKTTNMRCSQTWSLSDSEPPRAAGNLRRSCQYSRFITQRVSNSVLHMKMACSSSPKIWRMKSRSLAQVAPKSPSKSPSKEMFHSQVGRISRLTLYSPPRSSFGFASSFYSSFLLSISTSCGSTERRRSSTSASHSKKVVTFLVRALVRLVKQEPKDKFRWQTFDCISTQKTFLTHIL